MAQNNGGYRKPYKKFDSPKKGKTSYSFSTADKFVNPYSFIPIKDKEPTREEVNKGNLSGKISCTIEIVSPTFIPNTTKSFAHPQNADHKRKVFYSYEDLSGARDIDDVRRPQNPVIPGSEIRGMIRNVYEQLTNSCFSEVDEFNLPYKRTNEPKELCIMCWDEEKEKWVLYTDLKKGEDYFTGALISKDRGFHLDRAGWKKYSRQIKDLYKASCEKFLRENSIKVDYNPQNSDMVFPGNPNSDYHLHVAPMMYNFMQSTANRMIVYKKPSGNGIVLDKNTIERFEYVLGMNENVKGGYTDAVTNRDKTVRDIFKKYINNYKSKKTPIVVYVDKHSKQKGFKDATIYISPSSMTKEYFSNKIPDVLHCNRKHDKCTDVKKVCPACRLFGTILKEGGAIKGRVRFSDAVRDQETQVEYLREITLPILSSPRISSTEFYLKPPEELRCNEFGFDGIWNYDYYTTYRKIYNRQNNKSEIEFLRHKYDVELAGRKVYWNSKFKIEELDKGKMNSSVTPVNKGKFNFDVYFEDLTQAELEELLFCLELKDCSEKNNTVHKIGAGKPIGMGQVKITVKEPIERINYMFENSLIKRVDTPYERNNEMKSEIENKEEAQMIIAYSSDLKLDNDSMIEYPNAKNKKGDSTVFNWFTQNRGVVTSPKIKQILPNILDDKKTLSKYSKK